MRHLVHYGVIHFVQIRRIHESEEGGELPLRPTTMLEKHIKPGVQAVDLEEKIGWHTVANGLLYKAIGLPKPRTATDS